MSELRIDSYKFVPRSMWPMFKAFPQQAETVKPAGPTVLLPRAKVALLTSQGLYLKHSQPSFDIERERRDPLWGDPTFRIIARGTTQDEIDAAHLHINPDDVLTDFNICLPFRAFTELEKRGEIGALATNNYSFMGYQGQSADEWRDRYGPELAHRLHDDQVNLLILAPS